MELSIFSFFTVWINIIAIIIIFFNFLIPNNIYILNSLEILYGLIFTVSICGLIIHTFYMDKIIAKYKKSKEFNKLKPYIGNNFKLVLNILNIITHIIPLIYIIIYKPDKSNISFNQIIQIYIILICVYIYIVDIPSNIYVGVPNWLIYGLAPIILICSTYYKKLY
jgi:hypothetical protein